MWVSDNAAAGLIEKAAAVTSTKVRIGAEDESPECLREIVDWALEHSPVHDALHRPALVSLDLEVVTSKS